MSVYFIQRNDNGLIKIGKARDVHKRLGQLKRQYKGVGLEPLAKIEGYSEKEEELHQRFASLHIGYEWFKPTDELIEYINIYGQPFYQSIRRSAKCQALVDGRPCSNWACIGGTLCGSHGGAKPKEHVTIPPTEAKSTFPLSSKKSLDKAAEYLGISRRTIFRLIERGHIKAEKFGNYWMVDMQSLDDYKKKVEGKAKFDPGRGKLLDEK